MLRSHHRCILPRVSGGFFEFHERVTRRAYGRPQAQPAQTQAQNQQRTASNDPVTVSQLTARIDGAIRKAIPETLYVRGEISNYKPHQGSGHLYFTLKDKTNCIECVMWKSDAARLKFTPTDGMELIATAKVSVYGQRGRYQLYVTSLRPMGQGPLELAFQQLRAKLEAQGLFAAERKKPLPRFPTGIVLVTSREAAACHDMLKVLRRFSWLRIMIYHVPVQGDGAARRIAGALAHLSTTAEKIGAQIILLSRGGGSLEDLWPFNEEIVARAVAASRLPIISGIGHEVDVTIADLVADHHAHTPTEAAQVATAHWRTAREDLGELALRMRRSFRGIVQEARHRLSAVERHEAFRRPMGRVHSLRQFLDDRQRTLAAAVAQRTNENLRRLQEISAQLERSFPDKLRDARDRVDQLRHGLDARISRRLRIASDELARVSALLSECHPRYRLQIRQNQIAALSERLDRAMVARINQHSTKLNGLSRQLDSLNPSNVLKRGFTLTQRKKDGQLLRSTQDVKPGDRLLTQFADGQVESVVQDSKQLPLFE
jgi:exodeoxyribonuclease VII large subunit